MIKLLVLCTFLLISSVHLIDQIIIKDSSNNIIESVNGHSEEFITIFKSLKFITILMTSVNTQFFKTFFNLFEKPFIVYNVIQPDEISMEFYSHEEDSRMKRSIYNSLDLMKIQNQWKQSPKAGYIIETNWNNLRILMDCLINSLGTFLFIINDEKNTKDYHQYISDCYRIAWKNIGAYDIYILINNQIITYDPFLVTNGSDFQGSIVSFADRKNNLFKNLNKYPLRIDIIESTYSVLKRNKSASKLTSYKGADIEIVNVLKNVMNFVGKFLYITLAQWSNGDNEVGRMSSSVTMNTYKKTRCLRLLHLLISKQCL